MLFGLGSRLTSEVEERSGKLIAQGGTDDDVERCIRRAKRLSLLGVPPLTDSLRTVFDEASSRLLMGLPAFRDGNGANPTAVG